MKKLALIIALTILPMVCNAQLNVKAQAEKIETLSTARMGLCSLRRQGDLYYLGLTSTNQFDDPYLIYLGTDWESSFKTIEDLIDVAKTIEFGSPILIDNAGESCTILKSAKNVIGFKQDGYAGYGYIMKSELEKFHKKMMEVYEE